MNRRQKKKTEKMMGLCQHGHCSPKSWKGSRKFAKEYQSFLDYCKFHASSPRERLENLRKLNELLGLEANHEMP